MNVYQIALLHLKTSLSSWSAPLEVDLVVILETHCIITRMILVLRARLFIT
jgi:hypothetical protein